MLIVEPVEANKGDEKTDAADDNIFQIIAYIRRLNGRTVKKCTDHEYSDTYTEGGKQEYKWVFRGASASLSINKQGITNRCNQRE